jgi:hypothetical protein
VDETKSIILLFIGLIIILQLGKFVFSVTPVFALGMGEKANSSGSRLSEENGTMTNGKNMINSARNMTFGSSLENTKMHLTEAIMDLKEGDTKGAIMQLNMTLEGIKMHETEMMQMINRTSSPENQTR